MDSLLLEVKDGVVTTWDGESHPVSGGAYLSPEAYLLTSGELDQLRRRQAEQAATRWPVVLLGAVALGFGVGYWTARRRTSLF